MAEIIPIPQLTAEAAHTAQQVLLEQERVLRYGRFGAQEAFELGSIARSCRRFRVATA